MSKLKTIINRIKSIEYFEAKKRLVIFCLVIVFGLFLAGNLIQKAYASYQSSVKINTNIKKALYIFHATEQSFNLDSEQIIPASTPYVYKFSVSNYNSTQHSDVDMEYSIKITTTTNLPLTYKLYKNQNHDDVGATDILTISEATQDEDGAWYNVFSTSELSNFYYNQNNTDVYSLVIMFPKNYYEDLTYADSVDNIEVSLISKQVIE